MDGKSLQGRRALITGATSGLGAHFAEVLAAHGVDIVLAARREAVLHNVAQRLQSAGAQVSTVALDVTSSLTLDRLASKGPFDILINNAGIVREGSALEQSESAWDDVLDTNLKGMFMVAQAVAHGMRERGGGTIVNIASILGLRQVGGAASYAVAKAGVIQLSKVLALEWARHGIRVNSLAPGYIETELNRDFWSSSAGQALVKRIPQRRLGQPADLDGALLLLVSDASRYITGSTIVVDGGHLVSSL